MDHTHSHGQAAPHSANCATPCPGCETVEHCQRNGCLPIITTRPPEVLQPPAVPAAVQRQAMTDAAHDVLAERHRQVEAEGWTPEHDDEHCAGEMATAAGLYALHAHSNDPTKRLMAPGHWPWDYRWWKAGAPRRMLVKAGALILAELERLDRATARCTGSSKEGQGGEPKQ